MIASRDSRSCGCAQGWVNGTFPNQGLTLRGPESSGDSSARLGFLTREVSGTTWDPRIVITYADAASTEMQPEEQATCPVEHGPTVQELAGVAPVEPESDVPHSVWATFRVDQIHCR